MHIEPWRWARFEVADRSHVKQVRIRVYETILRKLALAIGLVMLHEQSVSALNAPAETYLSPPELGAVPNDGAQAQSPLSLFASSTKMFSSKRPRFGIHLRAFQNRFVAPRCPSSGFMAATPASSLSRVRV
jgi:hypothetical protein